MIIGASRSRRQMIQRMCRVLRRKPDRCHRRFAVLYVESTIEDRPKVLTRRSSKEITDVADEVRSLDSGLGSFDAANEFLRRLHG